MADPVIIVKENPGKLKIEVYDENEALVDSIVCPGIAFSNANSEVEIEGKKYKTKNGPKGPAVELKVFTPRGS